MMHHVDLFVYQKNTDLNALSAYEAVHYFMNKSCCRGLKRYVHWSISYDDDGDSRDFIHKVTSSSYYLLNKNKTSIIETIFTKKIMKKK